MKYLLFLVIISIGNLCSGSVLSFGQQAGPTVAIRGEVAGINGIAIVPASLEFTKADGKPVAVAAEYGRYSIKLMPGKYTVTASAAGFCPRSREFSFVVGGVNDTLNFTLMNCSDCDFRNIDFSSPVEPDSPPSQTPSIDLSKYKYKREKLTGLQLNKPAPEIMFGDRQEKDDSVSYWSLPCIGDKKPAILAYGPITISATSLLLSKKERTIRAEGHVVLIDELGTKQGSTAELVIEGGELRVSHLQ